MTVPPSHLYFFPPIGGGLKIFFYTIRGPFTKYSNLLDCIVDDNGIRGQQMSLQSLRNFAEFHSIATKYLKHIFQNTNNKNYFRHV